MLEAIIAGQDNPVELADLAQRRMRSKIPQLEQALYGKLTGIIAGCCGCCWISSRPASGSSLGWMRGSRN